MNHCPISIAAPISTARDSYHDDHSDQGARHWTGTLHRSRGLPKNSAADVLRGLFDCPPISRPGMAWGSGLWNLASSQRPPSPENTRRRRPLAHNQHHRSLSTTARVDATHARPTNDSHTPWTQSHTRAQPAIPVSLVGYYPTCGRSAWRRPGVVRLGSRMREGCIPALGMGVDRRAFWPFLVRLRGLAGWGSGNNATPPALPLLLSSFLFGTTPRPSTSSWRHQIDQDIVHRRR